VTIPDVRFEQHPMFIKGKCMAEDLDCCAGIAERMTRLQENFIPVPELVKK
jgi:hypothetical protein